MPDEIVAAEARERLMSTSAGPIAQALDATNESAARRFFEELFGVEPLDDRGRILVWAKRGEKKESRWAANADEAAAIAMRASHAGFDAYFGLGIRPPGLGRFERGGSASVLAIPGTWADVDVADVEHPDVHKVSEGLAPGRTPVLALFHALGATTVIDSGHGLHAYWLFDALRWLATSAERERIASLVARWEELIRRRLGFTVDSVSDFARVLRVPGTLNWKVREDPRPVEIVWLDETRRYHPDNLERTRDLPGAGEMRTAGNAAGAPLPLDEVTRLFTEPVRSGERHIRCLRQAGVLMGDRKRPLSARATVAVLTAWCRAFMQPPLADDEVRKLVADVARGENRKTVQR